MTFPYSLKLNCHIFISGGLNVPILMVVFGFEFSEAAALSLCSVLGNVCMQLIINRNACHPLDPTRPLAYFDVVLVRRLDIRKFIFITINYVDSSLL